MFDAITATHQDNRHPASGLAASAGLHLAIIGALVTASRLLVMPATDKPTHITFPPLHAIAVIFKNPARLSAPHAAPSHHAFKPVLNKPAAVTRTAEPAAAPTTNEATGSESGETRDGPEIGSGAPTGGATLAGGTYLRLSHAPRRVLGEEQPSIPSSLLMQLRGSHAVVLAKIQMSARGEVEDVTIVNSTAPELDAIIRRHIATWRFEPPTSGGRATAVQYLQSFRFNF